MWRACPAAPRSPSIGRVRGHHDIARGSASRDRGIERDEVTGIPTPSIIATGPLTSDALAASLQTTTRRRCARVLRRYRAHRGGRVDRRVHRLPRVALRQGDDGRGRGRRGLPELPLHPRRIRAVHRRAPGRGPVCRPRVRSHSLLRGMHAGRGDGPTRPRHAALRAHETGWAS